MTTAELSNWLAVYSATGVCCVFATVLSIGTIGYELIQERVWHTVTSWKTAGLIVPKIW